MKVNLKASQFDWDSGNRDKNKSKHAVDDWECEEVFIDTKKVILKDTLHSGHEKRFIMLGKTRHARLLYLVFTIRNDKVRVISARDVTKRKEIEIYEKAT
ncbi:MAG TPA: BrnT family toxin [Candidatus Saccharimonadales bacterium]|jgi:hypothetical protein